MPTFGLPSGAVPLAVAASGQDPQPAGTTAVGTLPVAARADHVHKRLTGTSASAGIAAGAYVFPSLPFASATVSYPAGALRLVPLFLDVSVVLDRIGIFLPTPGSADSLLRFGVWAAKDNVGYPTGAPLLDTGTLAGNVNDPLATISLTVAAGKVWLGYVCNSATTVPGVFSANMQTIGIIPGVPLIPGSHLQGQSGLLIPGVTGALPNLTTQTYTGSNYDGNAPFVAARVASYTAPA